MKYPKVIAGVLNEVVEQVIRSCCKCKGHGRGLGNVIDKSSIRYQQGESLRRLGESFREDVEACTRLAVM
jgi:hypothetical protein